MAGPWRRLAHSRDTRTTAWALGPVTGRCLYPFPNAMRASATTSLVGQESSARLPACPGCECVGCAGSIPAGRDREGTEGVSFFMNPSVGGGQWGIQHQVIGDGWSSTAGLRANGQQGRWGHRIRIDHLSAVTTHVTCSGGHQVLCCWYRTWCMHRTVRLWRQNR